MSNDQQDIWLDKYLNQIQSFIAEHPYRTFNKFVRMISYPGHIWTVMAEFEDNYNRKPLPYETGLVFVQLLRIREKDSNLILPEFEINGRTWYRNIS